MKSISEKKYSVVDLFAGAGGLSCGFLQTGRFEIKAAFENMTAELFHMHKSEKI
jgi:DNA (cytosine-5)-methyltransferase 1